MYIREAKQRTTKILPKKGNVRTKYFSHPHTRSLPDRARHRYDGVYGLGALAHASGIQASEPLALCVRSNCLPSPLSLFVFSLQTAIAFSISSRTLYFPFFVLSEAKFSLQRLFPGPTLLHPTTTAPLITPLLSTKPPRKPIVMTGSQLPLTMPRSDARQNLIDSLTCATAAHVPPHVHLQEVRNPTTAEK